MSPNGPERVANAPAKAAQAAEIPFRKDSELSMPELGGVLITAVLLLAAFYALAWYAKRAGWLARLGIANTTDADKQRRLTVVERLPVSRKTVLYRLRDGETEYLLFESSAEIQVTSPGERP